jgi:uncharacterized protein YjbI with pentapeptide repeats
MARRSTRRRTRPESPQAPEEYDPAPAAVTEGAVWDCVAVDGQIALGSQVKGWTIQESHLTGVDFASRTLEAFRCRDTHFVRCDLSGAICDGAHLERVVFTGCRLSGTVLSNAHLGDVQIRDCSADMLDLRRSQAYRLLVEDSQIRAADLTRVEIVDGAILRSNLSRAILHDAKLRRTRLHGSDLSDIRNALALRGCMIGPEQQLAVGMLMLAALDITVTDDDAT